MSNKTVALVIALAVIFVGGTIGAIVVNNRMVADRQSAALGSDDQQGLSSTSPATTTAAQKWVPFYDSCKANFKSVSGRDDIAAINYCACVRQGVIAAYYRSQGNVTVLNGLGTADQDTAQIDADAEKILAFGDGLATNPDVTMELAQACVNSY